MPQIRFGDQAVEPDGYVVKSGQHRADVEMQRETVDAVRHLKDVLTLSREVGGRTPFAEHVAQCPQLTDKIGGGAGRTGTIEGVDRRFRIKRTAPA